MNEIIIKFINIFIKPFVKSLFCKHKYEFLEDEPTLETHWEDTVFHINDMDFEEPGHIFIRKYKCSKCGKIKNYLINDCLVGG